MTVTQSSTFRSALSASSEQLHALKALNKPYTALAKLSKYLRKWQTIEYCILHRLKESVSLRQHFSTNWSLVNALAGILFPKGVRRPQGSRLNPGLLKFPGHSKEEITGF